jgi:hypothetical protein
VYDSKDSTTKTDLCDCIVPSGWDARLRVCESVVGEISYVEFVARNSVMEGVVLGALRN